MVDQPHSHQPIPGAPDPSYAPTQHMAAQPTGEPVAQPVGQPEQPYDPTGAPPGYTPPAGYGPPPGFAQPAPSGGVKVGAALVWSLVSVVCMVLAVSLEEDGRNGWDDIGVWAAFAIASAAATMAPSLRSNLSMEASRAWQIGVAGAVGLAAFWVLFVLPAIERNVSFLATIGVVAGGLAVWLAPGRPAPAEPGPGQTW